MAKRRFNWWESALFVVLILLAAFILVRSSLFEVRQITVRGNDLLRAGQVVETSGIVLGSNIFRVQLAEAQVRIQGLALVKQVTLKRDLPGTIIIQITERRPLALIDVEGCFWSVAADGVLLCEAPLGTGGLPLVTGVAPKTAGLTKTLQSLAAFPANVIAVLSEVHVEDDGRLVAYTLDGIKVRLGTAQKPREQGLVLMSVLEAVRKDGRRVSYIDLSDPEKAVVMYV